MNNSEERPSRHLQWKRRQGYLQLDAFALAAHWNWRVQLWHAHSRGAPPHSFRQLDCPATPQPIGGFAGANQEEKRSLVLCACVA